MKMTAGNMVALHTQGSPLPSQGRGEGEGFATFERLTIMENPSPQSSLLPEGRGEPANAGYWTTGSPVSYGRS